MIKIRRKKFINRYVRIAIFIFFLIILYTIYISVINDGIRDNIDIGTDVNVEHNGEIYEHVKDRKSVV